MHLLFQGRVTTWSIDGPTGWLDGKLQAYHKSFDGFRGAILYMAQISCWEQTLVTACSDGVFRCLDLLNGSCCVEINTQALSHAEPETHALHYRTDVLCSHSCTLTSDGSGLLWIQDDHLCQVEFETEHAGSLKLPGSPVRLAALLNRTHALIGFDDGALESCKLPPLA